MDLGAEEPKPGRWSTHMSKVHVFGVRVEENEEYPFDTFLLDKIGLKKSTPIQDFGSTVGPAHQRLMWLGWLDQERGLLAGMICTPKRESSYSVLTEGHDGEQTIKLLDLNSDARELNFFLYSSKLRALVYQHKHGTLGPHGFMDLLRVHYNQGKKDLKKEELEQYTGKKKGEQAIRSRYKHPLRHSVLAREGALAEFVGNLERGKIIIDIECNYQDDDRDGLGAFIAKRREVITLKTIDPTLRERFAQALSRFTKTAGPKARIKGRTEEGEEESLYLDDALNKLALHTFEHDAWMEHLSGEASFKFDTFPMDSRTLDVLAPIQALHDILIERDAELALPTGEH